MINKTLDELEKDKREFEEKYSLLNDEKEKEDLFLDYINKLRVYLFDVNNFIKTHFQTNLTPFINIEGRNALNKGTANHYIKKSKTDFFKEIDNLINSSVFNNLDEENKKRAENAFYILKTYYGNTLK